MVVYAFRFILKNECMPSVLARGAIGGSFTLLKTSFFSNLQYSKCPFFHFTAFSIALTAFSILQLRKCVFYILQSSLILFYTLQSISGSGFFHFTAQNACHFHFTGPIIFPVLQPKFEHFTLYIFKKALFAALHFTHCPPLGM